MGLIIKSSLVINHSVYHKCFLGRALRKEGFRAFFLHSFYSIMVLLSTSIVVFYNFFCSATTQNYNIHRHHRYCFDANINKVIDSCVFCSFKHSLRSDHTYYYNLWIYVDITCLSSNQMFVCP